MSGNANEPMFSEAKQEACPHNVIRKPRQRYAENVYVCGSCSALFTAKLYEEPPNPGLIRQHSPPRPIAVSLLQDWYD